ncbi:MAG: hypothetical protein M1275_01680 [Patescibacteria group bacterium]|nr:hypothetical protein [Patescibacteria group bacterium]
MKNFFEGLGIYLASLAIALLASYWTGVIFFSGNQYAAGQFPLTNEAFFMLYGVTLSYPFFISLGLMGFLKHHQIWWTLLALVPIAVFLLAFGPELITYSLLAAVVGGLLGFFLSRLFAKRSVA